MAYPIGPDTRAPAPAAKEPARSPGLYSPGQERGPAPIVKAGVVDVAERSKQLTAKSERVPLFLNLPVGLAHMAWAMWDGFKKYGYASWRKPEVTVTATSMISACERHLQLLKDGQDWATEKDGRITGHHAGHAMACLQIYLDCMETKKAGFDDRSKGPAPDVWPCKPPEWGPAPPA